jgi:hypothetical protein
LVNIQIEFIFGKLFELLRVFENFFKDFNWINLLQTHKGIQTLSEWGVEALLDWFRWCIDNWVYILEVGLYVICSYQGIVLEI